MAENKQNNQTPEQNPSEILFGRRDKLAALLESGNGLFVQIQYEVTG